MILKSLNKGIAQFGFTEDLEFKSEAKFNGHQKGVAICVANHATGEVEQNFLPQTTENRDEALKTIMNDNNIVKVVGSITQVEGNTLVVKDVYYLPYYVDGHACFMPTVNFDNVAGVPNVEYAADIELLFVHNHMNRYAVLHVITTQVSIMDCVYNIINSEDVLADIGATKVSDDNGKEMYSLDFYDEVGNRADMMFEYAETLRDQLVSFRLIGLRSKQIEHE